MSLVVAKDMGRSVNLFVVQFWLRIFDFLVENQMVASLSYGFLAFESIRYPPKATAQSTSGYAIIRSMPPTPKPR